MLTQVFEWSKGFFFFFLLHSPEESCSNTRTADEGRQKRPIQQKILKPRYTNPPHYRQTSLANHRALPLQYGWLCSFTFCVCTCLCVELQATSAKDFRRKTNTCQNLTEMQKRRDSVSLWLCRSEQERLHQTAHHFKITPFFLLFIRGIGF